MKSVSLKYGKLVRIEYGPKMKEATATTDLLNNANTEKHYQTDQRDARGKVIRLGERMTYLDYLGEWVWYVFRFDTSTGKWNEVGFGESKEEAEAMAGVKKGGMVCSWLTALWTRFSRTSR